MTPPEDTEASARRGHGRLALIAAWLTLLLMIAAVILAVASTSSPDLLLARDKAVVLSIAPAPGKSEQAGEQAAAVPPPPLAAAQPTEEPAPAALSSEPPAPAGRPAWQRHALHRVGAERGLPRIAVVMRGLGLSSVDSEAAIERLPGEVSLSFSPYSRNLAEWTVRAYAEGHEVLMDLPMEPVGFPTRDPGPRALMVESPRRRNLQQLNDILARARKLVGVVAEMGSRFQAEPRALAPILRELRARGLIYVDNTVVRQGPALRIAADIGLPHAVNDRAIDDGEVSRAAIEARLIEIERIARENGVAVAFARPFPVTIELLEEWSRALKPRGFELVSITRAIRSDGNATAVASE